MNAINADVQQTIISSDILTSSSNALPEKMIAIFTVLDSSSRTSLGSARYIEDDSKSISSTQKRRWNF